MKKYIIISTSVLLLVIGSAIAVHAATANQGLQFPPLENYFISSLQFKYVLGLLLSLTTIYFYLKYKK